jgi:hypothetical protein
MNEEIQRLIEEWAARLLDINRALEIANMIQPSIASAALGGQVRLARIALEDLLKLQELNRKLTTQ